MYSLDKRLHNDCPPFRLSFVIVMATALLLSACAPKGDRTADMKIGMHFDAVLEFVIEYPLKWQKDRRVKFGRSSGEVRWTDPSTPTSKLRVFSMLEQPPEKLGEKLAELLPEHPDLSITRQEAVTLPAGDATHLVAATAKSDFEVYWLTINERSYTIVLVAATGDLDGYRQLLAKVTESFAVVK